MGKEETSETHLNDTQNRFFLISVSMQLLLIHIWVPILLNHLFKALIEGFLYLH